MRKTRDDHKHLSFESNRAWIDLVRRPGAKLFVCKEGRVALLKHQVRRLRDWLTEILGEQESEADDE